MTGDLAEVAEQLDASVQELIGKVERLSGRTDAVARQGRRNRASNLLLGVVLATVAVVGFLGWRNAKDQNDRLTEVVADLEVEGLERREAACEQADETRVIQRRMNKDAVLEYGEVIIEVASGADEPPDPAIVAQLREVGERRLAAIVNQLPGRRWDPEAEECVDEPVPTTTEPGG